MTVVMASLVTFDPDEVFMISQLATEVGVTRGAATSWVNSRLAKGVIEPPIFSLNLQDNKIVRVWTTEQGQRMVSLYRSQRGTPVFATTKDVVPA